MAESSVYQFKVSLKGSKPPIWRRIQVPQSYNFWELHCAVNDVMGWMDCHLHEFRFGRNYECQIGTSDQFTERIPETETKIADHFPAPKTKCTYEYDFGDGWEHIVLLEKIVPLVPGETYPKCLAGKRRCPEENIGGMRGHNEMCDALAEDDQDENYKNRLECAYGEGYKWDPEEFDHTEVEFGAAQENADWLRDRQRFFANSGS